LFWSPQIGSSVENQAIQSQTRTPAHLGGGGRRRSLPSASQSCQSRTKNSIARESFGKSSNGNGSGQKRFRHHGISTTPVLTPWFGRTVNCIDVQNQRGTIVNGFGDGFPNVMTNLHWFDKHYDINNLEVLHR
jgi:hypothetical protein